MNKPSGNKTTGKMSEIIAKVLVKLLFGSFKLYQKTLAELECLYHILMGQLANHMRVSRSHKGQLANQLVNDTCQKFSSLDRKNYTVRLTSI